MATSAFKGGWDFWRETIVPDIFEKLPEVVSVSGLGRQADTIEVTNADSASVREYIAGLADGTDVTIECNFLPGNAIQGRMITDVNTGVNNEYKLVITDGVTPKTYRFTASPVSWEIAPAIDDANKINFGIKISGAIAVT